jgi:hypothetical protein
MSDRFQGEPGYHGSPPHSSPDESEVADPRGRLWKGLLIYAGILTLILVVIAVIWLVGDDNDVNDVAIAEPTPTPILEVTPTPAPEPTPTPAPEPTPTQTPEAEPTPTPQPEPTPTPEPEPTPTVEPTPEPDGVPVAGETLYSSSMTDWPEYADDTVEWFVEDGTYHVRVLSDEAIELFDSAWCWICPSAVFNDIRVDVELRLVSGPIAEAGGCLLTRAGFDLDMNLQLYYRMCLNSDGTTEAGFGQMEAGFDVLIPREERP